MAGRTGASVNLYERLVEQDRVLVAHGFPPISQWWLDTLREFYGSGKRWLVLRVGRRGGKSSTLCRVAVVEALYGAHDIPPGDTGYWAFVSVNRYEAAERLVMIRKILDTLGIRYSPVDGGIRLEGWNRGFRVFPATIGGVSGFTSIGFVCDEMSKWNDKDSGVNPAGEVVRSLKPTVAGHPNAKGFFASSPFSTLDLHYEMFEAGNNETQRVASAPTWVARPTLTEQETHEIEPDEEAWAREFAAIPMGSGERDFFDAGVVERAVQPGLAMPVAIRAGVRRTAGADFAFERNASALAVVHNSGAGPAQQFMLADLRELKPEPGQPLMPSAVIREFSAVLVSHGIKSLIADPHYRMAVVENLQAHKLLYFDAPVGQAGKADTYVRTRTLLHEQRLTLPSEPHEICSRLVSQLKHVKARPTVGGNLSITSREDASGRHGDLVSALVLATWQRAGEVYEEPEVPPEQGSPAAMLAQAEQAAREHRKRVFEQAARANQMASRRILRRVG